MSNVLTAIAPVLYSAAQIVPRELVGFAGSVATNFDAKSVAYNDTVKVPVVPTKTVGAYTPAMTTTAGSDTTPTAVTLTLSNNRMSTFNLTGEEEQSLLNGGENAQEFMRQNTEQAIRAVCNEIEAAIALEAYTNASRAYGTAGATPFNATLEDASQMLKILLDNGMPKDGNLSLIIDTAAGLNIRKQITINNNSAGSAADSVMRSGELVNLAGLSVKESSQVYAHTKGTGANYQINLGAGYAVGIATMAVDTGAGTVIAGDVLSFDNDANKYVVNTALSAGSLSIGKPGLRQITADNTPVALAANFRANVALHRNALVLVVRPPLIPANANIEQMTVTDAKSGLSFLMCRVVGDGMITYRVHAVYGVKAVQPEGIAVLLG